MSSKKKPDLVVTQDGRTTVVEVKRGHVCKDAATRLTDLEETVLLYLDRALQEESQTSLANRSGVPQPTISQFRARNCTVGVTTLDRLCTALGLHLAPKPLERIEK